jgi:hypothetical protein
VHEITGAHLLRWRSEGGSLTEAAVERRVEGAGERKEAAGVEEAVDEQALLSGVKQQGVELEPIAEEAAEEVVGEQEQEVVGKVRHISVLFWVGGREGMECFWTAQRIGPGPTTTTTTTTTKTRLH